MWAGRTKITRKTLMENDCREVKLTKVDAQERNVWTSGVRPAMRAASQLPGGDPGCTEMDDAHAP